MEGKTPHLQPALARSFELTSVIAAAWNSVPSIDDRAKEASHRLCVLSIEYGLAIQALLPALPAPGIALLRPQYESLVRATWACHSASGPELDRLLAPLTAESQQAAKKLPSVPEMLAALEKSGPKGASRLLARARSRMNDGLNSFIHGGIVPFARQREGYPDALLIAVLQNSNGFSMLALVLLATIMEDEELANSIPALNASFQDVLPALEPFVD
ncbi:MAG: DUF6988 family protein [Achromobacter mucicolens]